MFSSEYHHDASFYRVEVSGWDRNQAFFVEKSNLEWRDASEKMIALRHTLADHSMIFLKLLPAISLDCTPSMPYRAEFVAVTSEGRNEFLVRPARL